MFQQRTFLPDTYFYGRILLQDDTGSYLVLLRKLLQRFENDSDLSSPLLVNTLGWVEGIALVSVTYTSILIHSASIMIVCFAL